MGVAVGVTAVGTVAGTALRLCITAGRTTETLPGTVATTTADTTAATGTTTTITTTTTTATITTTTTTATITTRITTRTSAETPGTSTNRVRKTSTPIILRHRTPGDSTTVAAVDTQTLSAE